MLGRSNWQPGPTRGVHRWDFERLDSGEQQDREMLAKMRDIRRKHKSDALPPTAEQIGLDKGTFLFFVGVALGFPGGAGFLWMLQLASAVVA